MRFRHTLYLAVILVVLATTALVLSFFSSRQGQTLLFPDFDSATASSIALQSPTNTIELIKEKEKWTVKLIEGSYPADVISVENALSNVKHLKAQELVSKNPAKQAIFEVEEKTGLKVKISDAKNKVLAEFYLGKSGPGFMGNYVRRADSSAVYLNQGYVRSAFEQTLDEWKDKTIWEVKKEEIQEVTITQTDSKLTLLKENDKWQVQTTNRTLNLNEKQTADLTKVDILLDKISHLKTASFPAQKELTEYGLQAGQVKNFITLKTASQTFTLNIGKLEDSKYYVQRADQSTIFTLSSSTIDDFFKKTALDFLPTPDNSNQNSQ